MDCIQANTDTIPVIFKRKHLWLDEEETQFYLGLDVLYDLLHIGALDVQLLKTFTLHMVQEAQRSQVSVAYLDPQSISTITHERAFVISYLTKAFNCFHKAKKFIVFAYNTGGHWVLVLVCLRWAKVLYLDSTSSTRERD
ncbi:hypothetical protein EJB05_00305, partial [Eragrostis curvula]